MLRREASDAAYLWLVEIGPQGPVYHELRNSLLSVYRTSAEDAWVLAGCFDSRISKAVTRIEAKLRDEAVYQARTCPAGWLLVVPGTDDHAGVEVVWAEATGAVHHSAVLYPFSELWNTGPTEYGPPVIP